jgi:hypothetical protein
MIQITGQTITLSVGTIKEVMRKLVLAKLDENDDNLFTLEMTGRSDANLIIPFPNNLDLIEPSSPLNIKGHPVQH